MQVRDFQYSLRKYLEKSRHDFYNENKIEQRFKQQFSQELDKNFINHIQKLLGSLQGKYILEIGSGSGWRCVAMSLAGGVVTGIEPLESGIEASVLRSKRYPNLHIDFRVGAAEELPFVNNSFDLIVSFQVIEHVQNIELSLKEMYRALKKGGAVYMETGNSAYPREEHYRIFWPPYLPKSLGKMYARIRCKNSDHLDHVNFIYKRTILKMMKEIGFSEVKDLFRDYILEKFIKPETVKNRYLKKILMILPKGGYLSMLLGRIVSKLGIYPSLWLLGKK